jgi:hypothetical protein
LETPVYHMESKKPHNGGKTTAGRGSLGISDSSSRERGRSTGAAASSLNET